jgi:hypothetical protein
MSIHDLASCTLLLAHIFTAYICYRAFKVKAYYAQLIEEVHTELWRHNVAYDADAEDAS